MNMSFDPEKLNELILNKLYASNARNFSPSFQLFKEERRVNKGTRTKNKIAKKKQFAVSEHRVTD